MNENKNENEALQELRQREKKCLEELAAKREELEKAQAAKDEWDKYKADVEVSAEELRLIGLRLLNINIHTADIRLQGATVTLASNIKQQEFLIKERFLHDEFETEWRRHDIDLRKAQMKLAELDNELANIRRQMEEINANANDNDNHNEK